MGYAENKKLAKDINNNTNSCANRLRSSLNTTRSIIDAINSFLETISVQNKRYEVPDDTDISTVAIFNIPAEWKSNTVGPGDGFTTDRLTARYSGFAKVRINCCSDVDCATKDNYGLQIRVLGDGLNSEIMNFYQGLNKGNNQILTPKFSVDAGRRYYIMVYNSGGTDFSTYNGNLQIDFANIGFEANIVSQVIGE